MSGDGWPTIFNWTDHVRSRSTTTLGKPVAAAYADAMAQPYRQIRNDAHDWLVTDDPALASGRRLEVLGNQVGELRGGLQDEEYRRIVAGRIKGAAAKGKPEGLWLTWLALTGADEDRAYLRRLDLTGTPTVLLGAVVSAVPTSSYLRRMRYVLDTTVAAGVEIVATVGLADVLTVEGTGTIGPSTVGWSVSRA